VNTEKFIVRLNDEERQELQGIVKKLRGTSQTVNRTLGLLHADANGPNWTNGNYSADFFLDFFASNWVGCKQ
jgi:hypothetical protein